MWELFNYGKIPYPDMSNEAAAKKIIKMETLEIGLHWPKEIITICGLCWKKEPTDRTDMKNVLDILEPVAAKQKAKPLPPIALPTNNHSKEEVRESEVSLYQNVPDFK